MTKEEKQAIRDHMTAHRKEILDNVWSRCANCGSDKNIEIHHIVPLANGGNHIFTNMVALCKECHLKAHGKLQRVSNPDKVGRKPMELPDNYENIILQYLIGQIDRAELIKGLGFSEKVKLYDIKPYQDYLKEHHIVKVVSNVARHKNPRFHDNHILTVVYFDNHRVKRCVRGLDGKIQVIEP